MSARSLSLLKALVLLTALALVAPLRAGEIARADLDILGLGLEVDRQPVITAIDVPANLQTIFGGKMNDEAPAAPGLSAIGELTGPGINTPITLATIPGQKFAIPALHEKGEYSLQNIRLVGENGEFLQQAVPSFAIINVTEVLKTEVRARQLTPQELRERGITVDARNFDVYEYTIILGVGESRVEIPYPVIVDRRTGVVEQVPKSNGYALPPLTTRKPPRYVPPQTDYFTFGPPNGPADPEKGISAAAPSIPAAIVLPSGFGVLHQFFAVILQVSNGAPDGSNIRIDSINAAIAPPQQMRVAKVTPAVTIGQPVPIHDATTGATFLVAGAQGSAEWTLEALKTGTHAIDVTVEGVYQKPGQEDVPLRGHASTSVVVSDPRFQINFSHPDVVRVDESYTAYAFVTNLSPQAQHVMLDLSQIPECSTGGAVENVCRVEGTGVAELDLQPGEMIPVPYKLTSKITGNVFAGAGTANDETIGVSVKLTMGVSESGIPLSAATLVMPHYSRYLPSDFVAANMQLLGLGYSLATAPLNAYTAKFPRVITTDVFQRAQDITRAGQRIFVVRGNPEVNVAEENRDAFFHLALDLLGNIERIDQADIAPELTEWDQLRRMEKSGRRAAAAMARQLEIHGLSGNRTPRQFVDDFAAATSHRSPFVFAYAHGADVAGQDRPYALSLLGVSTNRVLDVPAEATAGWVRMLPYGELTRFDSAGERGELALLARVSENIRIRVIPQASSFTLHLLYPDTANGAFLRSDIDITGATPGQTVWIDIARGWRTPMVNGASGVATVREVGQTPLRVLGAAQDLFLNRQAHLVSILFNRPLSVPDVARLRDRFALTTSVPQVNYTITRRNTPSDPNAPVQVPSAALQEDGRLINVTFDKALSKYASYTIAAEALADLVAHTSFSDSHIVPRIDNNRPGAILTGRVIDSDNTPIPNAGVELSADGAPQIDLTDADGRFLYEFVERDIDRNISGNYSLRAVANGRETSVQGAVRLIGEVHTVNLVFLGRGTVRGHVRYDDGSPVPHAYVNVGSALHDEHREGFADGDGYYELTGLAVGPITVYAHDGSISAQTAYATNMLRTAGEVVTQDLVIFKREYRGSGTVRVTVRRADTNEVVPDAEVGVQTSGYSLYETRSDANGLAEFRNVPVGLVSIIAAHFGITRESFAAIETDLRADQLLDQTIILPAPVAQAYSNLSGIITRDDPAAPGDRTKDQIVPGAVIRIGRLPAVTAGADGSYLYPDVPPVMASARVNAKMLVFDPATGRQGQFDLPSLLPGDVHYSVRLSSTAPEGYATVRVRLTSATGLPVNGYKVMEPGFPPSHFTAKGGGVYELTGIQVPNRFPIVAVPGGSDGPYGEQMTQGSVRVDFNGQVAVVDMRLPGQGNVIARVEARQPDAACAVPPCYAPAIGRVAIQYAAWDDFEQHSSAKTIVVDADSVTQTNAFQKVPALQTLSVYTDQNPAGFASSSATVGYDGDVRNVTLRLESIGDVTGRVFAHDRQTPIAGALVELENSSVVFGAQVTKPDGSFRFAAVPASLSFRVVAESSRDGIYRTGSIDGATPLKGGPVSNLVVVMREQSAIEGQVVDTNGQPVPLAYFWVRELWWPNRSFGSATEPLQADINGRFLLQNVFTGPFRITAKSPTVQEVRGDYQGTLAFEGDTSQRDVKVQIGGVGTGTLSISVVDSLQAFKPMANTEVTIYRGRDPFDIGSTDDQGIVQFHDVVAGTYSVGAYAKVVGRAGRIDPVVIVSGETTTRQIALEFLGKVSGSVTDPESEPLPNAPSKGTAVQVDSSVALRETTDSEGKFSMLGVPEGPFNIYAYDFETGRIGFGPSGLFISKVVQEHNDIHLELERMATLHVKVYLPNDSGGPGELAPLAAVSVEATDYVRAQQGNNLAFPRMIPRYAYRIVVRELGGEQRQVVVGGSFPPNTFDYTQTVVLPASGTVQVKVLDGSGQAVPDAQVTIGDRTIYTGADGIAVRSAVPFGPIGVQARKGGAGASASGTVQSRSIPLQFVLNLGSSASITGFVEGEVGTGIPSIGTRVVMTVTSSVASGARLEALTGADGTFLFSAVPIGSTHLTLLYYGPDDTTIGAERAVDVPNGTTGTYTVPPVKLDATPPRVVSINPAANTNNVSPSSDVLVTFSEPIAASFLNANYFQLISTDDNAQANVSFVSSIRPDGTFQVKLVPPSPPAGQRFPLKSNVLYRIVVRAGIQDTTGNALVTTVGSNFTTVNYTEPSVVRIDPAEAQPLPSNTTLRIKFNKPVDITSLDAGYGGVLKLEKLSTRGGTPVREVALSRYLDVADPAVIVAAVTGESIEEASFYRLTISGIRDTQTPPNVQVNAKIVDFFSFDSKRPLATIVSPVPAGEKLITDVLYTAQVSIVDEITGATSTDIDSVDWFDANGQFLRRVTTPPYSYAFVAPNAASFTLKVSANDLSGNSSPSPQAFTWEVAPNEAPANVTVVNTPAALYPAQAGSSVVTFTDEGLQVTAALELHAKKGDGTDVVSILGSKSVSRASTTAVWPSASFNYTLPLDLQPGTAQIVAKVSDVAKAGTGEAALEILNDNFAPEVLSFLPAPETRYPFDATYTIELQVRDAQTGLKSVTFSVGGTTVPAAQITHSVANDVHTYRSTVHVPPKNADTRIAIVARAYDNRDNVATTTSEVVYERHDDANVPQAAWVTPLDQAAIPFGINGWQTTLRIRATDESQVTSVDFASDAFAAPVAAITTPKSGTTDIFETKATFNLPANGAPFVVTAFIHDGDPNHTVELPITLTPIVIDPSVPAISTSSSISSITAPQYENKSVVVRGPNVRVTITVPLHVKDLILVDGATVSTFEETKLDLTIADHLFVDADSKIDVTDKGYLGAHRVAEDNVLRNDANHGRTLNGVTGARNASGDDAAGSYAGLGGEMPASLTNAPYGSITAPRDFGSGGSGSGAAGNGGGAALLSGTTLGERTARFVVAGSILADGGTGVSRFAAGSGGTVSIDARTLITGPSTRISANGGDDDASATFSNGGGGGRLAVRVAERLDVSDLATRFAAHGGQNGATDGTQFLDGGAGTFFLARPGATLGEVIVSSFDARQPSSTHRTRGTVLSGALTADNITIGPRALARFDSEQTSPITVDSTALVSGPSDLPQVTIVSSVPAAGSDVAQSTTITPTFTAQGLAGITRARVVLAAQPSDTIVNLSAASASVPSTPAVISIPANASSGATTLKVVVTDRAGRTAESTPLAFSVVSNAAPVIDSFVVIPSDQIYAGGTINVSSAASDDVEVKSLTLASIVGTVTAQTATKPTPQSMARQFSIALPKTAPSGTNVVLTLSAADDFPNRAATTAQHTVAIRHDDVAPVVSVIAPAASQQFNESANGTFTIDVQASDAEVGVNTVKATFEGTQYSLQPVAGQPGRYSVANVPIPSVDGIDPVAKTIAIAVTDFEPNTATSSVTIFIKPLIDPNAPKVNWVCSSPSAMYPAGYAVPLRIFAEGTSAQNGVQRVEFSIDGGAPIAANETAAGSKEYLATFTIPGGAAAGVIYNVRAAAISTSGNEATLLGTITVVAGVEITTTSEITANDLAFENLNLIVRSGGVLTITGPHTLANVVVLDGGKLVQKHPDLGNASALTLSRLYVACNGTIDVSGLGYAKNTTYPGSGNPDDSSGGSHIGRGGLWNRQSGTTFGSVYRPAEGGGGGQMNDPSYPAIAGGGSVRIHASSMIAIDGSIKSRVTDHFRLGSSAGGSVWITTPATLTGAGTIDVTGGSVTTSEGGAGGGGSIALEYGSASGALFTKLIARGGTGNLGRHGGAGSIYLKASSAPYGDLMIDNKNVSTSFGLTDLPALGRVRVASVSGTSIEIDSTRWLSPAMAGHSVRVFAADGSVRGTWRIASITNDASTKPVNGFFDVPTQDAIAYDGYIYFSPAGLGGRKFVAVRYVNNRWEYDDNATFTPFTPQEGEGVIASFRKDATSITELVPYRCAPVCSVMNGVPTLELSGGEIVPNAVGGNDGANKIEAGIRDNAEFFLRLDGRGRGLIVSKGVNTRIALEAGATVQAGDVLRGVYRFDNITIANARVMSEDLVESTTPPVLDATSSLIGGNVDVPAVNTAAISIARGLEGPVIVGTAGAVADSSLPIHVVARNATRASADGPVWNSTPAGQIVVGDRGGMSVLRSPNGWAQANGLSTLNAITISGFASFSASQTNQTIVVGLAPSDTTVNYVEPGTNGFKLLSNGTYELWANGASVNKNGAYTTATVFRIEKTPSFLRWFVDDVQVHEVTSAIPPRLVLDLSFESALTGEIHSIDYDTTGASEGRHRAAVGADGSFKVPVFGQPGDAVTLFARDGHAFPLASDEVQIATIGNDIGVASLTFSPAEVTGGRTALGTISLKAPAGADGAHVVLSNASTLATVPSSITIAAGQTVGTFNVSTQPIATPVDLTITASYGGLGTNGVLRIVKDNVPPAVTITAPTAGAQFTEGAIAGIPVQVTIVEQESGLAQASATLDGVTKPLVLDVQKGPNVYTATFATPYVEGTSAVPMNVAVTAIDNTGNSETQNVSVVIKPVIDSNPPTLTWSCFSSGGAYPIGDVVPLQVVATAPNSINTLRSVQFFVTDPSGATTPFAASVLPNNVYELQYTVPTVADGAQFSIRALVTTAGGTTAELTRTFIAIADAVKIQFGTMVDVNTTTYEGKSLVLTGGTTTINGTHSFKRLVVYSGATVIHAIGAVLNVQAENVFVACGGAIDVSGRGLVGNTTYPGATPSGANTGGSHIGYGGLAPNSSLASTYGSVYHPTEAGFGGSLTIGGAASATGGGVVQISSATFTNDGSIRANGTDEANGASGGSVWIKTTTVSGTGIISAEGGVALRGGGGGAIAIEYATPGSVLFEMSAVGGASGTSGGAGTILIKGPSSAYGNLTIDNGSIIGQGTDLPALGSGLALNTVSGPTLVTDRAADVPAYFVGHWVRVTTALGIVKGTWKIGSIDHKSVTLVPNGTETINVQNGDRWQGVYRFDSVALGNTTLTSVDPIETTDETIDGTVTTSSINATNLRVHANARLTHPVGGKLQIVAAGEVRVDAGGAIDVSGMGYVNGATYPGATGASGPSAGALGGSHLGRGGQQNNTAGLTYGSMYRPLESGAASGVGPSASGGGAVKIIASSLVVDGSIRSNGTAGGTGGAGGSVWISTSRVSGSGTIETNGGLANALGAGGGGALSIEFNDGSSSLPALLSRAGTSAGVSPVTGLNYHAGAGSLFVKGPASIYGDLTVDSGGPNLQPTILSSLGTGSAVAGTSANVMVTNRGSLADYFIGHWVEVSSSTGTVKGTWRIASIAGGSTLTLAPNGNETISLASGDTWRGLYRFDNVKLRTSVLRSTDPVFITNPIDKDASSQLVTNLGAPQFPVDKQSQIVVQSAVTGDAVVGPAGAVTDPDTPIQVSARNTRTLAVVFATANADGSFRVPVAGAIGDTFTVSARDTSVVGNLTSASIPVNGAIVETNTVALLTVEPATVIGGTTTYGSVRLTAAARVGGLTIGLSSSNPNVVIPATVFIPSGATTAQFVVTTSSVTAALDAQITATFMASAKSATLTVTPATTTVVDVVLAEATVEGGASLTGTVLLGGPAPSGGALVTLTSDSPYVTVPTNVVVAEGNTQASFLVATSKVSAATSATITAVWGSSDSASLGITACAAMGSARAPVSTELDTVWSDDGPPSGATASGEASFDATQVARGSLALHFAPPNAAQQRVFSMTGAAPLAVSPASELVLYALVNPCNPPRQILVTWSDGTTQWSASFGESRFAVTSAQIYAGALPRGGEWIRLSVVAKKIGITANKNLTAFTIGVDGGEVWFDAMGATSCNFARAATPAHLQAEVVWFDDALPSGAVITNSFTSDASQAGSGSSSFAVTGNGGIGESSFTGATDGLALSMDDMIVVYALVDPCNPPREIMLQFHDGSSFSRRAFWGEDLTTQGSIGSIQRRRMGPVPDGGGWVRLEVPVSSMQMSGFILRGLALDVYDGRAWFEGLRKVSRVNVALGKLASQSSTSGGDPLNSAGNAIDGNTATSNSSVTNNDVQAWWQVDLGAIQPIDSIDFWSPNFGGLKKFYVLVSDQQFVSSSLDATLAQPGVSSYYYVLAPGRPTTFEIHRTGRYVRVQMSGQGVLAASEVQVWAPVTPGLVNISGGKPASQKSTYSDFFDVFPAAQAVDGNTMSSSYSQTLSEAGAWWEVDLGSIQPIDTIDIDNVFGSDVSRLSNFYLFVSNQKIPDTNSVAATLALSDVSAYYRGTATSSYTYQIRRSGRYVRVQLTGTNILQMREVHIWSPTQTIGALAKSPETR